jgi:tRNA(Ile)-lysidine synthase
MALLSLLRRYARSRRLSLTVAHLDHAIRRGSRQDRLFVERAARSLDLPCVAERLVVSDRRRKDESPEEAARRVRRDFLVQVARDCGCERIATGHTLDDQAETVLMRLVRGAGSTALAGIPVHGSGGFVRPLLGLTREELRAFLARRKVEYREDPSNRDLRFDRNRVRLRVMPLLREQLNPQAARHLVQAAERLREDASFLDGVASRRLERNVRGERNGQVVLRAAYLARQPPPLATRMARQLAERAGVDPRRVTSRHVEALLDLAAGATGRSVNLPGRLRARRTRERLVLERDR